MFVTALFSLAQPAQAETRTLKLMFIHTGEKAEITFKRNGRYDQAGLKKLNQFLRDWRRNEPTKMDPRLFDLVWEAYRATGASGYIHVVSAYRSPATNSMLRSRSKGVAEKSQHMLGKAMDFYIPGVNLKKLRDAGLKAQAGGVGYYPRSGSPFVHLDVGSVRHWPRMSRKELVAVFPKGKTLHVPSDGKPLPGYETALASYQSRKKSGGTALALASTGGGKSGGLLAALFGGGADEEEDSAETTVAAAAPKPAKAREQKPSGKIAIVPPELADPATPVAAEPEQTPQAIIAALPPREIPLPAFAPRPKADVGAAAIAAADIGPAASQVPFGMAEAPLDPASPVEVAANVPVPSWRPDLAPAAADAPMLMALAETGLESQASMTAPLPSSRPAAGEFVVASLPGQPAVASSDAIPSLIEKAEAVQAQMKANEARLAALAETTARKDIVTADRTTVGSLVGSGVRTTPKSARPTASDTRPDPKPLVIAAQPDAARWALYAENYVATGETGGATVAHHIVRTAPSEVYATGFQKSEVADAARFTGKAVHFLPVAHFATN